jgi:hypothetical protein
MLLLAPGGASVDLAPGPRYRSTWYCVSPNYRRGATRSVAQAPIWIATRVPSVVYPEFFRNVFNRFISARNTWKIRTDHYDALHVTGCLCLPDPEIARQGPIIIKERMSSVCGELAIESTPGRGALPEIALPRTAHG